MGPVAPSSMVTPNGAGSTDGRTQLEAFLAGDPQTHLIVRRSVWYVVASRVRSLTPEERDDLVSETIHQVWGVVSRPGFEMRVSLSALARHVATARCVDWLRKHRPHELLSEDLRDHRPGPEDLACASDRCAHLERAIATLSPQSRRILSERLVERVPFDELADRHGVSSGALRSRFSEAIRRLRKRLRRIENDL